MATKPSQPLSRLADKAFEDWTRAGNAFGIGRRVSQMNRRDVLVRAVGAAVATAGLNSSAQAFFYQQSSTYRLAALEGGDFAIRTSRLAQERSRSGPIQRFAEVEIAEQSNIAAALSGGPGSVSLRADHAAMIQELAELPPRAFDRVYVEGQLRGHRELLQINTTYPASSAEQQLAASALPTIRQHIAILALLQRRGSRG